MKFVTKLEQQLTPLDRNFLRKIVSRINTLKISNPELNKFLVQLDDGEIVVKNMEQIIEPINSEPIDLPFVKLPEIKIDKVSMNSSNELVNIDDKMRTVAKEAIDFTLKNMGGI